jgi:hypothetical protein
MSGSAFVTAVSLSPSHSFSKARAESIRLIEGLGDEGDAHCGATVPAAQQLASHRGVGDRASHRLAQPLRTADKFRPGDEIRVETPPPPYQRLDRV